MTQTEGKNQPKPEGQNACDDAESPVEHRGLALWHPNQITRLTAWVTVFTGLLTFVAAIEIWAVVKSDSAFLAPLDIDFVGFPKPHQKTVGIRVKILNSGKRTAVIKKMAMSISHKLAKTPQYSGITDVVVAPIPAGGTNQAVANFSIGWDEKTTVNIRSGEKPFYVIGLIQYSDGYNFWGLDKSGFCYVYRPSGFQICQNQAHTYNR